MLTFFYPEKSSKCAVSFKWKLGVIYSYEVILTTLQKLGSQVQIGIHKGNENKCLKGDAIKSIEDCGKMSPW